MLFASSRLSGLIESLIWLFASDFELTTVSKQSRLPPYLNIHLADRTGAPSYERVLY